MGAVGADDVETVLEDAKLGDVVAKAKATEVDSTHKPAEEAQPPAPPTPEADAVPSAEERRAVLAAMPAFKLKQAAKAAGVQPVAIGSPARSKEETIALILELEASGVGE